MDNFDYKKYLAENRLDDTIQVNENKIEEEYKGQFGSQTAQDLAVSKAKFSNAILALDPENLSTAHEAEKQYIILATALVDHLQDRFDNYNPHLFLDRAKRHI